MRVFIDTNLWVDRLDRREPEKAERIRLWLAEITAEHQVVISTQVLIELRSVASRKLQPPLSQARISGLLEALRRFEVVPTDSTLVLDAHQLACRVIAGMEIRNPLLA